MIKPLLILLLLASSACAQTAIVLRNRTNDRLIDNLKVGPGKTFTFEPGATVNFGGATIVGLPGVGDGGVGNGDKGDISVVLGSWEIDAGAVGAGELAQTMDLSSKTLTLPSDVSRLGPLISLVTEVEGLLPDSKISSAFAWNAKLDASLVTAFGLDFLSSTTNTLARSKLGLGTMATQASTSYIPVGATSILLSNGSNSAPSLSFTSATTTGIYKSVDNGVGFSISGASVVNISGAGLTLVKKPLIFEGATSGSITLSAPAIAGTQSYTWPGIMPTGDGQVLSSTSAGVWFWQQLGTAAFSASTQFATFAQGALADTALQPVALTPYLTSIGAAGLYQPLRAILTDTTASFTTALKTKVDGIATGAEVNVNADWNASTGDAQILNKPTLGTAAAQATSFFATAAQGALATTAVQPAALAGYQPIALVLTNTTASFTTTLKSKLDGIQDGAESNVNADWNSLAGDNFIMNKPTLGTAAAQNVGYFATAAQGALAATAVQPAALSAYQPVALVLTNTTASFTTALQTKLNAIATGAEVNVNPDWNSVTGDSQILNKPTLGTAAAQATEFFATAAQGALADTAVQPVELDAYQPLTTTLTNTTASFTTALESKLNGIEAGANNYVLPAPGVSTLGGVKRNTGGAGQFVVSIASDGSLVFGAPAGGGDALTSGNLSQFANTTSAQLLTVITDESGTGNILTTNGSAANLTSFPTFNQSTTGNAATATALLNPQTINGISFNGTAPITIAAAAGTLTGTSLAGTIVTSNLTALGEVSVGTWEADPIADAYIASAATWNGKLDASLVSAYMLTVLNDVDQAAAHTTLGLGTLATQNGSISNYLTIAAAATDYQPKASVLTGTTASFTTALETKLNGIATGANNYVLPTPGVATLGGVMRNTGSGGQFVTGIASDGSLTYGSPAGGGDALVSGTLAQFANTTSAQLLGIITDESGTGSLLTTNGSAAGLTGFPTFNQNTSGNAATATALQTAQTINGTLFDGTAPITIAAAASTLTGSALASGVTSSSLTGVGTLTSGGYQATPIADAYISSAATWSGKQAGDATLTALAGAGAANTFPYFSATDTIANASITTAGRNILDDADTATQRATLGLTIGTHVQAYSSILDATTASFTTTLETKLNGIAASAEVNVNPDWNSVSGDSQILNKPTLGTASAQATSYFATAAQGALADTAVQPAALSAYQPLAGVLTGTTASFTTALDTKLSGIATGAEVNVSPDWNSVSGDSQILNKPTLGTASAQNVAYFATAAQGALADTALQPVALAPYLTSSTAASTYLSSADGSVTNAKLADMPYARIKGRISGPWTGVPEDLTITQVKNILDLENTDSPTYAGLTIYDPTGGGYIEPTLTFSGGIGTSYLKSIYQGYTWTLPEATGILAIAGNAAGQINLAAGVYGLLPSANMATVNSNVGNFGSATTSWTAAVNAKGQITSASNVTITPAIGSITGMGANVSGFLTTASSANLRLAMTDESGTGAAIFAGGHIGSATATTVSSLDNSTSVATTAQVRQATMYNLRLPFYLGGLKLVNDTTDANNDLQITDGGATSDVGTAYMFTGSTFIKRLDAVWAVGSGQGGLDTGTEAASTWYSVWIIMRVDTMNCDILFSTSETSPTMPTDYSRKRRIGWVYNNASSSIEPFVQHKRRFYFVTPTQDMNISATTTSQLVTLRCPPSTIAMMSGRISHASADRSVYISSPLVADVAPTTAFFTARTTASGTANSYQHEVLVNSSSQVRVAANGTAVNVDGITFGWVDDTDN